MKTCGEKYGEGEKKSAQKMLSGRHCRKKDPKRGEDSDK